MKPSITTNEPGRAPGRPWIDLADLNWPVVFLLYTLGATISASTVYSSDLAEGRERAFFYPVIWEFTGYFVAMAVLPLMVIGFGRLPIKRHNWMWTIPIHIMISMALGIVETLLMLKIRSGIYAWLDLGPYDYGQMPYRFVMEYNKQFLYYWLLFAVLWAVAHYRRSRAQERHAAELELRASELQRQLGQSQLQALRSQLNPHFLFNTLNMVSSVMYENVERADQMIATLSRMLRMSLQENVDIRVPVRRELEFVQCFTELVRARFGDRVCFDIQCVPECRDRLMPNLLLHTLIENAIKHHDLERTSVIQVQARVEQVDSTLKLSVIDNGPGIPDLAKAIGNGVGLKNTQQRLAALYGEHYKFEIQNRPEVGLSVQVTIPLETSPEPNHEPSRTTEANARAHR